MQQWMITYYSETVRKMTDNWPVSIRAYYARITERMMVYGPNLGMPFTRSMGRGLFEIRAHGKEGIGRAFFCTIVGNRIVVLHGFIKKTEKTSKKDLEIARKRMLEVRHENA